MAEITQKQIDDAIKNCSWRKDIGGIDVCSGMLAPCIRTIEKVQCDTLKELFRKKLENEEED